MSTLTQDLIEGRGGPAIGNHLVKTYLFLYLFVSSYFYAFIGVFLSPVLSALIFVPISFFFILWSIDLRSKALALFLGTCLFILVQILQFSHVSGSSPNYNSLALMYGPLGFIVFLYDAEKGSLERVLEFLYWCCFIYVSLYGILLVLSQVFDLQSQLSADAAFFLVRSSIDRGNRIWLVGPAALYAAFFSALRLLQRKRPIDIVTTVICIGCFSTAMQRVPTGLAVLLFFTCIATHSRRRVAQLSFAIYLLGALFVFSGFVSADWNPYDIFGNDPSASVRSASYDLARLFLLEHPILGVGFESKIQNVYDFTGSKWFSPPDLGPAGIYFYFGILGVLLYSLSAYAACFATVSAETREADSVPLTALFLMGCYLGADAFAAPSIWTSEGGPFFGIILAQYISRRATTKESAAPNGTAAEIDIAQSSNPIAPHVGEDSTGATGAA